MTKDEWKDLLTEEELIFIPSELNKNKEENLIDTLAEMFSSVKGLRLQHNGNPIGDFHITKGEFKGENNRLYLTATSIEVAKRRAEVFKKAGYKADSAWELGNPWTIIFNIKC